MAQKPCGLLLFFLGCLLFPAVVFSQTPDGLLREALAKQGIDFAEGLLFSGAEANAGDSDAGFSLLISPVSGAAEKERLFILALPIEGMIEDAAVQNKGETPFRFRAAIDFVNLIKNKVNIGSFADTTGVLVVFLGYFDRQYLQKIEMADSGDFFESVLIDSSKTVFWYFESDEAPSRLRFVYRGKKHKAPLFMVQDIPRLCAGRHIPFSLKGVSGKDGFENEVPAALDFLRGQEIAALYARGETTRNPLLETEQCAELFAAYAESLAPPEPGGDYQYSVVPLPGPGYLFISQTAKLACVLVLAALALGAAVFRP